MKELELFVPDVHCEGCARHVRDQLREGRGIASVSVDVQRKRVSIRYEPDRIGLDEVMQLLGESGFPPSEEPVRVEPVEEKPPAVRPGVGYAFLIAFMAVLALIGYLGYEIYPRFGLPRVEGAGLFILAAGAGVASFFSPCAFPLLVTLLARESAAGAQKSRFPRATPFRFAVALSLGAAVFLLLAGAAIALGGRSLFAEVTFTSTAGRIIRVAVGAFLILLGLVQVGTLPSPLHAVEAAAKPFQRAQAKLRRKSPTAGFVLFGFGYLIAGFG